MAKTQPHKSRRNWTIIVVPPQPSGRTHTVHIHGRQVRGAAIALGLAFFSYTGWSMLEAMQVSATTTQLAEVHTLVLTLSDSLQAAQQRAESAMRLAAVTANVAQGPTLITRHPRASNASDLNTASAGILLPVIGTITSKFSQSRLEPLLNLFRPHEGVDISAPLGTSIRAPADGRVTFVGHKIGYGLVVELDHGGGVSTLYAHCEKLLVHVGDYVAKGATIAKVGSTGLSTAPHVHFEVLVNGRHVDPLRYLLQARDSTSSSTPVYAAGDHDE